MFDSIQSKKEARFLFLEKLYQQTNGSRHPSVDMWQLGKSLGLDKIMISNVTDYLEEENLIEFTALGGEISITHQGIIEVEKALSNPSEPTTYFPPVSIININSMSHSQIQQGTSSSSMAMSQTLDPESLRLLLDDLTRHLPQIPPPERGFLEGEIQSIEGQLKAKEPKIPIIISNNV
jgi:hypothetical protein